MSFRCAPEKMNTRIIGGPFALFLVFLVLLDCLGLSLYVSSSMVAAARGRIAAQYTASPRPVVIIFGGGVQDDGTPAPMLEDRLATGAELYQYGYADRILITGDDGANRQDELTGMHNYLVSVGVPEQDILVDDHGYHTYHSCDRARRVFGITEAIGVSQQFHLPRILYLCTHAGIDMVGVEADRGEYDGWWTLGPREYLARTKAWIQVNVAPPRVL